MHLSELMAEMRNVTLAGHGDPGIISITADSREVTQGALFAALPGSREDGAKYVRAAIDRGAAAILTEERQHFEPLVPCLVVENARKALGEVADIFYHHPSRSLDLVGVTGTNGKTTTAYLLRHLLNHAGQRTGMLGTIEYDLGGRVETAPLTTPDAVRFTRSLAEMRDFGCRAAVVETSSHALDQGRVWPHRFAAGIFTNLTRDHLDYHGDMESYFLAKKSLFDRLDEQAVAVLNFRDPAAGRMVSGTRARVLGHCLTQSGAEPIPPGCHRALLLHSDLAGQRFRLEGLKGDHEFFVPLVGWHNIENSLGAILAAYGLGVSLGEIAAGLASFSGVPGRLEQLVGPNGVRVFVDYAHTDDALRSVLSVLRPLTPGRLITVFGCGGDRDRGKRPLMAKAAEEQSDLVYLTSDNPRTESPQRILDDILPGFAKRDRVTVQPDRAAAIRQAVRAAGQGDVVLVAGKGHENYQIIGTEKQHLDDRELVRDAFSG